MHLHLRCCASSCTSGEEAAERASERVRERARRSSSTGSLPPPLLICPLLATTSSGSAVATAYLHTHQRSTLRSMLCAPGKGQCRGHPQRRGEKNSSSCTVHQDNFPRHPTSFLACTAARTALQMPCFVIERAMVLLRQPKEDMADQCCSPCMNL